MAFSLKTMWQYKCPKCRSSYLYNEPFQLNKPLDMKESCSSCGQRFEPEPGFYFGAMFISYIIAGWGILLPTLLLVFYYKWSVNAAMGFAIFLMIITYIPLMRISRSLWIHFMVKYDARLDKREE